MIEVIGCVLTPVQEDYLNKLVERKDEYTTLVWPGRGQGSEAHAMKSPQEWLSTGIKQPNSNKLTLQKAVPFLFRAMEEAGPPFSVTHAGLAVYMVDEVSYLNQPELRDKLRSRRVEGYCRGDYDVNADDDKKTWYVVTASQKLSVPIPYDKLSLLSEKRRLKPNFMRGYATVRLPEELRVWHSESSQKHSTLLSFPHITRWKKLDLLSKP